MVAEEKDNKLSPFDQGTRSQTSGLVLLGHASMMESSRGEVNDGLCTAIPIHLVHKRRGLRFVVEHVSVMGTRRGKVDDE